MPLDQTDTQHPNGGPRPMRIPSLPFRASSGIHWRRSDVTIMPISTVASCTKYHKRSKLEALYYQTGRKFVRVDSVDPTRLMNGRELQLLTVFL